MDLSGLASFASAAPGGFQQGQSLQADLAQRQEQAKQARLQTQEMMDERAALSALGNAFGLAPPPPPMPQGPGQPSMPAQPPAMPGAGPPPGAPAPPPMVQTSAGGSAMPPGMPAGAQPGAPPGAPPKAAATMPRPPVQAPQAAPPQQPRPQPQIPPQIAQNLGQMTTEQLAQRIIAANPGIKDRPDLLVRAMAKGQALLVPDGKATVAAMQMQVKLDALQNKLDVATMNDQTKVQVQNMLDAAKTQIQQLKDADADKRLTQTLEARIKELEEKIAAKHEDVAATNTSREKIAGGRNRAALEKEATKQGLKVDASMSDQQVQDKIAETIGKKTSDAMMSDDTADFMADAVIADPPQAAHIGGYGATGQMNRNKVWNLVQQKMTAAGRPASDLAAAKVAITGAQQEARTIGAQAGSVALGTEELKKFAPLVQQASDANTRTQYPTINAIEQAFERRTGGTQIITLHNQIQALKNAYTQILVRNGRPSDAARKQAGDTIDEAWSQGQIGAALQAMDQEAKGAGEAAGAAQEKLRSDVSDQGGTMVTDARKVAKLRSAGDDKAYEKARDDYLKRYGKHGGEEALRKALKSGAEAAGPQPLPEDKSKLEEGVPYQINNATWYWNGKEFTDQKPD